MICTNNKLQAGKINLEEGKDYQIVDKFVVKMTYWKKQTRVEDVEMVKLSDWRQFEASRFTQ